MRSFVNSLSIDQLRLLLTIIRESDIRQGTFLYARLHILLEGLGESPSVAQLTSNRYDISDVAGCVIERSPDAHTPEIQAIANLLRES